MNWNKKIYVLVFEGFDDAGVGPALAALASDDGHRVVTCGLGRGSVTAASGLKTMIDIPCEDIELASARLFLLPDGPLWQDIETGSVLEAQLIDMLQSFDAAGVRLAACGTSWKILARAGLLDGVRHAAERDAPPAVHDQNIITARHGAAAALAECIQAALLAEFQPVLTYPVFARAYA